MCVCVCVCVLEMFGVQEKKLLDELETGKGDESRLKAVYDELRAIGADSAEPRARRILAVSFPACFIIVSSEAAIAKYW